MLGVALVLGAVVGVAGNRIELDYYGLRPGGVYETESVLEVSGIETFPSDGEVLYATVNIGQLSIWEWIEAELFADNTDVLGAQDILGDRTDSEKRDQDLAMMQRSTSTATLVALNYLGYEPFEPNGTILIEVLPDGPAAGVLQRGDVVLEADGVATLESDALREVISAHEVGDDLEMVIERSIDEEPVTVETTVTLGSHPETGGPFLGVTPDTRLMERDVGFSIDVDSGSVGGPSAGLAFTLAMIDLLTEGDLVGGGEIAVTGTMGLNGCVGPIGGMKQKAIAVSDTDAKAFIVPASQADEALAHASSDLVVIPVHGLDDALDALAERGGDSDALPAPIDYPCEPAA